MSPAYTQGPEVPSETTASRSSVSGGWVGRSGEALSAGVKVPVPLSSSRGNVGFSRRRTFCSITRRCNPAAPHSTGREAQIRDAEQLR